MLVSLGISVEFCLRRHSFVVPLPDESTEAHPDHLLTQIHPKIYEYPSLTGTIIA